jgi:hypothetical protein
MFIFREVCVRVWENQCFEGMLLRSSVTLSHLIGNMTRFNFLSKFRNNKNVTLSYIYWELR